MPTNHDYWNETIHTIYTNVVEIYEADNDYMPVDPSKVIRLNDSGGSLTMYDADLATAFTYDNAVFSFNEPDRNSINDETGSFSVAGVTSEYIEMLNEVLNNDGHNIVVRLGLVNRDDAIASVSDHSLCSTMWIYPLVPYVAADVSVSSATATLNVSFRSGSLQLQYNASKVRYSNVEFPCLFG